ncbi:serine hydrolase [Escherichia coli]
MNSPVARHIVRCLLANARTTLEIPFYGEAKAAPGSPAAYSNLAFDLLADALANASGKPYTQLFEKDYPSIGDERHHLHPLTGSVPPLMVAERGASPCNNTLAAIGSGGVYSTPGDRSRWMQQICHLIFISAVTGQIRMQTLIYQRAQFTKVIGMDVPGKADALGLGWVYSPERGSSEYSEDRRWWRFHYLYGDDPAEEYSARLSVVTRSPLTRFKNMSDGINNSVTELSGNKPLVIPAS